LVSAWSNSHLRPFAYDERMTDAPIDIALA
jgi:hypothetical protein